MRLVSGFKDTATETEALAALGLKLIDEERTEICEIWPEHLAAFKVFRRLATQWNVGLNGVIGLRYETLRFWLDLEGVERDDWLDVVTDLQVMEREQIKLLNKR